MAPRPKRIKNRSVLFVPISIIVIVLALFFGFSIFLRISDVEVEGNSFYTAEEIVEASGIERGDNLFFINRSATTSRIYSRLPYIELADVRRSLPNRVVIAVTESQAIAYVTAESGYWVIDEGCKLLSQPDMGGLEGLLRIEGLTPIAPAVGERIEAGQDESAKVTYLSAILKRIALMGLRSDVTAIDMSNVSNPSFDYLGRFTVKLGALGSGEDLDYKFQLLVSAVGRMQEGDRGTLSIDADRSAVHLTRD